MTPDTTGCTGYSDTHRLICILRVLCYRARTRIPGSRDGILAGHPAPGQFHCDSSVGVTTQPSRVRFAGLRPPLM